jgi:predicted CoA-substrate-specific enzyme activase
MKFAGIDIGSRTIKFVIVNDSKIEVAEVVENSYDSLNICKKFLKKYEFNSIIATGYGRTLLEINENIPTVSEIKAFAVGIDKIIKGDKVVLDIGGQDTKFIKIKNGRVVKFEMNDRCAAGTGKFFEIMANTLGYKLADFSKIKLQDVDISISSMCAVFAESEVTSLLAKGVNRESIAIAVHKSIVKRIIPKIQVLISNNEKVIFCGGCAKNNLLKKLMEKELKREVFVPDNPQIIGAFGASIISMDN